jgi:hypothetical protein
MYCVEHPTLFHYTSAKAAPYIVRDGIEPRSVELGGRHCFEGVWLTKNMRFEEQYWASSNKVLGVRFKVSIGGIDDRLFHWNSFREELNLEGFNLDLPEELKGEAQDSEAWFIFLGNILPGWLSGVSKNKAFPLNTPKKALDT